MATAKSPAKRKSNAGNLRRQREHALRKELDPRVERGARLLDGVRPDWWQEIDKATLDMQSGFSCIVGQVFVNGHFASYGEAVRSIEHIVGFDSDMFDEDCDMHFGFNMPYIATEPGVDVGEDKSWSILAEMWLDEVKIRAAKARKAAAR